MSSIKKIIKRWVLGFAMDPLRDRALRKLVRRPGRFQEAYRAELRAYVQYAHEAYCPRHPARARRRNVLPLPHLETPALPHNTLPWLTEVVVRRGHVEWDWGRVRSFRTEGDGPFVVGDEVTGDITVTFDWYC